jgi:hypothetical protein
MYMKIILNILWITAVLTSCKSAFDSISIKTDATSTTLVEIPKEFNQNKLIILDRTDCSNQTNNSPTNDIVSREAFKYLKKEIEERDFYTYDQSLTVDQAICTHQFFPVPLERESVLNYTANDNVLLTVENIVHTETDEFRRDVESTYDENEVLIQERNVIIGQKTMTANAAIKVYDTLGQLMDSLTLNESYSYEVKASNKLSAQISLKKGRDLAVENIGKKLGFEIAESISPYYIKITRYYFAYSRTNSRFNRAQDLISEEGDWYTAGMVWQEITERYEDETDRAKAYFNLGVLHEKNSEFKKAIEMLEKSTALNEEVGGEYFNDLKKRYSKD